MDRKLLSSLYSNYRKSTSFLRPLPDFIIVGAQKAGTTSLYDYLDQHANIRMSKPLKEVQYFSYDYHKGINWYRSNFPIKPLLRPEKTLIGEASPYYLFHPHSANRIHASLPNAKIIAVLRDPTERAISHYFHELRHNTETKEIFEALKLEESRIAPELKRMLNDENYESKIHQNLSYKSRGLYLTQLKKYFDLFDSKNILVINSNDLFSDPISTVRRVCQFLEVDDMVRNIDVSPKNVGSNKSKVSEDVYSYLNSFFRDENKKLFDFLGEDFGW